MFVGVAPVIGVVAVPVGVIWHRYKPVSPTVVFVVALNVEAVVPTEVNRLLTATQLPPEKNCHANVHLLLMGEVVAVGVDCSKSAAMPILIENNWHGVNVNPVVVPAVVTTRSPNRLCSCIVPAALAIILYTSSVVAKTAVPVKVPVTDTAIPVAYVTPAVEDIVPLSVIEVTLSGEFAIFVL